MKTDPFRLIGADATRTCWRVSAIYRCCLRYEASPEWALGRLRDIFPDGTRDHMVDVWFMGMEGLRARRRMPEAAEPAAQPLSMAA